MKLIATRKSEQNQAVVDPWTVVHFSSGLALGLVAVPLAPALGLALAYEVVEQLAERRAWGRELFETSGPERLVNAVADVAMMAAGHQLGRLWNRTG